MKEYNKNYLLLLATIVVCMFVSSCSKDDDLNPQVDPQPTDEFVVDTLLAQQQIAIAQEYGPVMYHLADSIAALHGGKVCPINYKTLASTLRKCWTDSCQATAINDLVRCTIACPYDSLTSMITDLAVTAKAKDMFGRYKHQEYLSRGYWGDLINLDHKKLKSEIQVKSFYMAYACYEGDLAELIGDSLVIAIGKETGKEPSLSHHYYEIIRDVTGKYTDAEKEQAQKDNEDYVKSFWEKYTVGTVFYKDE